MPRRRGGVALTAGGRDRRASTAAYRTSARRNWSGALAAAVAVRPRHGDNDGGGGTYARTHAPFSQSSPEWPGNASLLQHTTAAADDRRSHRMATRRPARRWPPAAVSAIIIATVVFAASTAPGPAGAQKTVVKDKSGKPIKWGDFPRYLQTTSKSCVKLGFRVQFQILGSLFGCTYNTITNFHLFIFFYLYFCSKNIF